MKKMLEKSCIPPTPLPSLLLPAPTVFFYIFFFTTKKKKHREIKNIQHVCIIYISGRFFVHFFFCKPSLFYIFFNFVSYNFFFLALSTYAEGNSPLPASPSRLLNQRRWWFPPSLNAMTLPAIFSSSSPSPFAIIWIFMLLQK